GSTTWPADSDVGARYRALTAALRTVVEEKLPEPLRRYEAITQLQLAAALEDPVEFAQCFHTALELILVTPLRRQFATLPCEQAQDSTSRAQPNLFLVEDEVAKFVGQAMTELDEVDGPLWEDLETLIWVVESRPADARRTLLAMSQRYATEPRSPLEAQLHRLNAANSQARRNIADQSGRCGRLGWLLLLSLMRCVLHEFCMMCNLIFSIFDDMLKACCYEQGIRPTYAIA
ncbi:MAG TPA: hypothetical protein PKE45_04565, partial [Caldilineaceae bacterium]|nr:hypothetical protein [Caldilineaceae bacterium]